MAEEKSSGFRFAEEQMLRHGWKQGKGLGRQENGIAEAIKVKVKCDKGGVGHREGEQFTFHWWDHVFNKAASSLAVESGEDGVMVKKTAGEEEAECVISNKKPRKAELAKAKLYGRFIKSATLLSGQEQPEDEASSSKDSTTSEDEDHKLDLSSTTKLSDEDLVKACGGRTAHKGARHGLTMGAKLARLEQQEQEFMAKYGKKTMSEEPSNGGTGKTGSKEKRCKEVAEAESVSHKKKKKRSKEKCVVGGEGGNWNGSEAPQLGQTENVTEKKRRKRPKHSEKHEVCLKAQQDQVGSPKKRRKGLEGVDVDQQQSKPIKKKKTKSK